jgi:two-component system OmpR family response regulator
MERNDNRPAAILIVDDEEGIVHIIENHLMKEGYLTCRALGGHEAVEMAERHHIDLILLDWMMPGMNGLDTLRRIRETVGEIPVIFLTAKTDEVDKLLGLELGADDYITKPFSLRELVARIRAVLRRWVKIRSMVPEDQDAGVLVRGGLRIDVAKHSVYANDAEIALTPTEMKLLHTLAAHPGRVFSRLQLLEIALGMDYEGYERSIDTHIWNLRKKIEPDPGHPVYILTVFGVGYKFGERP